MNLQKIVLEKIEELGEEAEAFFERTGATLKIWKNQPNKIPAEAAQKVLALEGADRPASPNPQLMPEPPPVFQAPPIEINTEESVKDLYSRVQNLHERLYKVEHGFVQATVAQPAMVMAPGTPVAAPVASAPQINWTSPHQFVHKS